MDRFSLWWGKGDCGCQGACTIAILTVDVDCEYFPASHRIDRSPASGWCTSEPMSFT